MRRLARWERKLTARETKHLHDCGMKRLRQVKFVVEWQKEHVGLCVICQSIATKLGLKEVG